MGPLLPLNTLLHNVRHEVQKHLANTAGCPKQQYGDGGFTEASLQNVKNPDGPLAEPMAAQESVMFLKPAQHAEGEKVLRIVDFIDKIVSNFKDRTTSDLGTT